MPLDYTVLPNRRAIIVIASGTVTPEDHEQLVARLLAEPALEQGIPVLVDGRGISTSIDVRHLPRIVTTTRLLMRHGMDIIAIVTDAGPVLALARAFELASRAVGVHVAVFEDVTAARVWLRLPKDDSSDRTL